MTNEEINAAATEICVLLCQMDQDGSDRLPKMRATLSALVAQAYEEALQLFERLEEEVNLSESSLPPGESHGNVPTLVSGAVKELRALKDQLLTEPAPV